MTGQLTTIPWAHKIQPYEKQRQAIFDPPRHALIEASPKAGKTAGCLQWFIERTAAPGVVGNRHMWVAPVLGQAEIAFRRGYTEMLDRDSIEVHKTNRTIELPNGHTLVFRSGDRPDLIYGDDSSSLVIDEAQRLSEDSWIAAHSTTNHTSAPIRIITNVTGRVNWASRLAKRVKKGEIDGWEYHRITQDDAVAAGVVASAHDAEVKAILDSDTYRTLYGASEGVESLLRIHTENIRQIPLPDVRLKCRGWDLAVTETGDWTVGVRVEANSEGFWITDVVRDRVGPHEVIELIRQTAATDGPDVDQVVEEEKGASGRLFVETIRRELYKIPTAGSVWPAGVEMNKIVRAWPMVVAVGQERVHLAEGFEPNDLLVEFEEWPDGRYVDCVDAAAHGFNYLADKVSGMIGSGAPRY